MTERIVFGDIEQLVIDHLDTELPAAGYAAIPVSTRVPRSGATFIRVMRSGGAARDLVTDQPTVIVEAWAPTETAAHTLAQTARSILHACQTSGDIAGTACYSVGEFAGPSNLPDPSSKRIRYTATYSIAVRGAAA